MAIFRRRSRDETEPARTDATVETGEDASEQVDAPVLDRSSGPFDHSEVGGSDDRIDLGALRILGAEGMQLRLEIDQEQQAVVAASVLMGDSNLQLQAFAAPRSEGLWESIRGELSESVTTRGGSAESVVQWHPEDDDGPAESVEGPCGIELRTRMPSQDKNGRTVFAPARFLGVDGPRWFLRGVISGRAAVEDTKAEPLLQVFRDTVVVRGQDPMAPRELLTLTLPTEAQPVEAPDEPSAPELNPFERGPEITEVR